MDGPGPLACIVTLNRGTGIGKSTDVCGACDANHWVQALPISLERPGMDGLVEYRQGIGSAGE
jgi:hypothetical protein